MKSFNWKDTTIQDDKKIEHAIKSLINSQLQICLIVDKKNRFIGTITDGDIRRGLLKGFSLNSPLKKIINKNCLVVGKEEKKKNIKQLMLNNSIYQIPVIDKNKKIFDLYTLSNISEISKIENTIFVLMAGGFGKRLMPFTKNLPKAMLKVGSHTLMEHIIYHSKNYLFNDYYISIFHLKNKIKNFFQNKINNNINIKFIEERKPLGTIGSLYYLKNKRKKFRNIVVSNCDVITNINYHDLVKYHNELKSDITMVVKFDQQKSKYGIVNSKKNILTSIKEKPERFELINLGIYVINKSVLKYTVGKKIDITEIIEKKNLKTSVFPVNTRFYDFGDKTVYLKNKNKKKLF